MTDHFFRDEDRKELTAVVNRQRVSDEFWSYHASARPCLYYLLITGAVHLLNLLQKFLINVRAFFCRASHSLSLLREGDRLLGSVFQNHPIPDLLRPRLKTFRRLIPR